MQQVKTTALRMWAQVLRTSERQTMLSQRRHQNQGGTGTPSACLVNEKTSSHSITSAELSLPHQNVIEYW